ncbi:MAG: protein kinase [Dehalococcoidia bacterium]|jgi:tetratricopeptide (TPR) repeat protein|nr:protein kinase [Dehalococcoidia bacterium]
MVSERTIRRIERLLDEADEAITSGDWSRAQQRARDVLAFDPENQEAAEFLVAAERRLGTGPAPAVENAPATPSTELPSPIPADAAGPTTFADGRYNVRNLLGEGGKERVYLAHDTLLDREVAFALIKTEGFDNTSIERITREAQAMGRLGTHPNIVTVFDLGTDAGSPYMVTELMGGGDVEALLESSVTRPTPESSSSQGEDNLMPHPPKGGGLEVGRNVLPLERTIEIGKAVCEGLEFAHSRGIVHRDLKPGNVWLTEDGTAKIGDFGLAVMTDRSRLTREGMMVGTVAYMPPEQATGGDITPVADLYSLGAMLYEMVTGRPPFLGDDEIAIIGQHINTAPVAPAWHNGDCPRPLEALIVRLLAKDPAERPDSAQDVINALDAIDLAARGETVEREGTSLDSLAGGVFVGRQAEMDQLKAGVEDILGGRGRLLTLVGEPGIGKTRTSEELATYAGLRGAQVLWGRCYETGGQPPYWPWVQAIRSYVRETEADELRRQMGSSASVIAEIVTDVNDRLPDLQPALQLEDPDSARFRLFDSIVSFLKSASQSRPLVIVLDDLHWSDQPSLNFLEFAAREIGQSRVMLIGTYRDMELNRRHPLTVTLGDLSRERLFERVLLRGLTEVDISRFVEIAAGFAPPPELSATIHRHTEGNPLFVTEVVRELVQSGELAESRISGASTWSVRIPEGVREVIGRRLDRLSQRTNDVLTVAAVVGRDFRLNALKVLVEDTTDGQLLDVLDEALDARIIEELSDGVGHYQFTHALMQETLTGELSLTRRVRFHARIAEALEAIYRTETNAHAAELAYHFGEAETLLGSAKLVHYSAVAGGQALAANAMDSAAAYFDRALSSVSEQPVDAEIALLHAGAAKAHRALRNPAGALQHTETAYEFFRDSGDSESALALFEDTPVGTSLMAGLYPMIQEALTLIRPGTLQGARVLATRGAIAAIGRSDWETATESFLAAQVIADETGDRSLRMRVLEARSMAAIFHMKNNLGSTLAREALESAEGVNEPLSEASLCITMMVETAASGDHAGALAYLERGRLAAERSGNRQRLGRIHHFVLKLHASRGDWDLARAAAARSLAIWPENAGGIVDLAAMEYELGNFENGRNLLEQWLEVLSGEFSDAADGGGVRFGQVIHSYRISGDKSILDVAHKAEAVPADSIPHPIAVWSSTISLGYAGIIKNDSGRVERALETIRRHDLVPATMTNYPEVIGLTPILLSHDGNTSEAESRFVENLERLTIMGYRPQKAWTLSDYAEMLLDRDEPGDHEKAIGLQDEALAITRELGMRPLTERILQRRDILRA